MTQCVWKIRSEWKINLSFHHMPISMRISVILFAIFLLSDPCKPSDLIHLHYNSISIHSYFFSFKIDLFTIHKKGHVCQYWYTTIEFNMTVDTLRIKSNSLRTTFLSAQSLLWQKMVNKFYFASFALACRCRGTYTHSHSDLNQMSHIYSIPLCREICYNAWLNGRKSAKFI